MEKRTCTRCKTEKSVTDFYRASAEKDGYQFECKVCARGRQVERLQKLGGDPSRCWCGKPNDGKRKRCPSCVATQRVSYTRIRKERKASGLCQNCGKPSAPHVFCDECEARRSAKRHGGTLAVRMELFKKQDGICPLCEKPLAGFVRQYHAVVDHDHETGRIRGLVHDRCNMRLNDIDEAFLIRALAYVRGELS